MLGQCLVIEIKMAVETAREKALSDYKKKLLEHRELDARLKESKYQPSNMFLHHKNQFI